MKNNDEDSSFSFPLGEHHRDEIRAKSGRTPSELSLNDILTGNASEDDLSASFDTLMLQAQFAQKAGYEEVAKNLIRAAEMTRIPNDELLKIYDSLRPGRSTYYQLLSLCQQLTSQYDAEHTGAYIREAADAYRDTGLLKMDDDL